MITKINAMLTERREPIRFMFSMLFPIYVFFIIVMGIQTACVADPKYTIVQYLYDVAIVICITPAVSFFIALWIAYVTNLLDEMS